MPTRFEFATATRILFGAGVLAEVAPAVKSMGRRAFVVTGRNPDRAQPLLSQLKSSGIEADVFLTGGEPTIALVQSGAETLRAAGCDVVVAIGGGSVVDAGKAIAALATNRAEPLEYLEVIGRGRPLEQPPLPFVAIPTTAGTGAEVTRNSVLSSPEHRVKVSLRSPMMLPRLAVVDPELSLGLPAELTASTGMDALTQLIEPFLSCRANPMTDAFCRQGIPLVARSLRRACEVPGDLAAREDMALASLLSGLALANSGLGAVHGFAAAIGGMYPAPHGAVCAAILPHAMRVNWHALREREPGHRASVRFDEVAAVLTGKAQATAEDGLEWLKALSVALAIPRLSAYGVSSGDATVVCEKAAASSSMKGNPISLMGGELAEILGAAL